MYKGRDPPNILAHIADGIQTVMAKVLLSTLYLYCYVPCDDSYQQDDSEFAYVTNLRFCHVKKNKLKILVEHNNQKVETTHMSING